MAGEFVVGAVFEINPTPAISALESIGRAFESIAGLATSLQEKLATVGEAAFAGLSEAVGRATGVLNEQIAQVDRLSAAYDRAAVAAERAAVGGGSARSAERGEVFLPGPRAPHDSALPYSRTERSEADYLNQEFDRRQRQAGVRQKERLALGNGIFSGMGPFVAPFIGYEAEKGAFTEDAALSQALIELGYSPGTPEFDSGKKSLRGKVSEGTLRTIFSESGGSKTLPGTAGQFGAALPPGERLEKYEDVLPGALKFAEVSELYHRGGITESLKAAFSYINMAHPKNKDDAIHDLDTLLAIALSTGNTVAGEQNTLKYSVPIGQAAGVPTDKIAAITGFFEMMGMSGTTAGTGVGQILMGLTNTGGPLAAQQQKSVSHSFEEALHLNPEKLHEVSKSRGSEHVKAMERLHLFDPSTGRASEGVQLPGGKLNIDEVFKRLEDYLKNTPAMEAMGTLAKAFTVRGSREADLLTDPDMAGRMKTYIDGVLHPKSADQLQKELATTPLQQFQQMLANISNIGNTLATQTLPGLNAAFSSMNEKLIGINAWLKDNPLIAQFGGWGLLAAGVTSALGLLGLGIRGVTTGLGVFTTALGVASTKTTEAAGAMDAAALGLRGLVSRMAPLLLLKGDTADTGAPNAPSYDEYRRREHQKFMSGFHDPEHHLGLSPAIPKPPAVYGPPAPPSPSAITITINNAWNGITDTASLLGNMSSKLADAVHTAMQHNSDQPAGSLVSPYTQGGYGF